MNLTIMLPIKTVSEQNLREHWGARSRRAKKQKRITGNAVVRFMGYEIPVAPDKLWIPETVRFTRFCRRRFDTDNSTASMKHIRDAVAKTLGTHDGPGGPITWKYEPDRLAEVPAVKVELLDFRWIPAPHRPEKTADSSHRCRPVRGNQVLKRPGRKLK